jgi:hypothetical protein
MDRYTLRFRHKWGGKVALGSMRAALLVVQNRAEELKVSVPVRCSPSLLSPRAASPSAEGVREPIAWPQR